MSLRLRNEFRNRVARANRTRLTGYKPRLVGARARSRFALKVFLPRQSPVKNNGLFRSISFAITLNDNTLEETG